MKNQDMILTCQKCRSRFYFTSGEQNFYKQKGLNIPKFCKNCRNQNKTFQPQKHIPRACSTCYFFGEKQRFIDTEVFPLKPGTYRPSRFIYLHVCSRSKKPITNDKPCSHWTKG